MMDSQLEYDVRIVRYEERSARINAEGWQRPIPMHRAIREAVASRLIAVARRLAPAIAPTAVPSRPLAGTTQA